MMGPTRVLEVLTEYAMPGAVSPQPDGGRTEIWSVAWQIALDAPWVGVGAGCFSSAWRVVETGSRFGDAIHAHNDALQAWAEQGFVLGSGWLILLILPLVFVAVHLRSLRRGRRRRMLAGYTAAYVAMLVASLVSFPAHIGALALLAALLIGALVGSVSQERRPAGPVADHVGRGFLIFHALLGLGLVASGVAGGPGPKLSDTHAELDAALAGAPLWSRGWLQRAELHVADGAPTDALLDLEVAAAAWPTSPWPHVARARLLRRMGRIDASRTAWRTALALNFPDNDPGRKWIEAALDGEPTPMAALFLIVPDRADRLRDAGAVARAAGDGLNATVFFQRAYELDPTYGLPLVRQLLFDGFVPDARRTFDTVPAVATQSCRGRVLEAEIELLSGAYDAALSAARAAIRVCGESDEAAWVVLVRARLGSGDRGAIVPMAKLVEQYPMRHGLRRALVDALRDAGDHAELAVHLRALVQSGVATDAERGDLDRLQRGLPPRIRP